MLKRRPEGVPQDPRDGLLSSAGTPAAAVYDRAMSGDPPTATWGATPPPGAPGQAVRPVARRQRNKRYVALAVLGPLILAIPLAMGLDTVLKTVGDHAGGPSPSAPGPVVATSGAVRLSVTDNPSPDDQPLAIRVQGLTPGHAVTVAASQVDYRGVEWNGTATFTADAAGTVTNELPSTGGSYTGVNPMGLVSLMAPADGPPAKTASPSTGSNDPGRYFFPAGPTWQLGITVQDAGRPLVSAIVERQFAPGIEYERYDSASEGFTGALYTPTETQDRLKAGVLVLDAGEGPSSGAIAARIAAHGHPALSVSYFGHPGQPADINRIPLETFEKPLQLLRQLGGADGQHIVILGSGPSTEAAQLLAATHPAAVHGLVLIDPDDVTRHSRTSTTRSSWTRAGKDVPFYAGTGPVDPAAQLHPERTNGPLLLVCGRADPRAGCRTTSDIESQLAQVGFGFAVGNLSADGIGASVGDLVPYQAHTAAFGGGTLPAESLAMPTVWNGVLSWLDGLTAADARS